MSLFHLNKMIQYDRKRNFLIYNLEKFNTGNACVFPLWLPYIHILIAVVFKSHSRFKSKWCATLVSRKFSQHPYGWLFALSTEAACLTVSSGERLRAVFPLSLIAGLWTLSSLQRVMWAKSSPNSILLASHLACITVSLPISVASLPRSAFLSDTSSCHNLLSKVPWELLELSSEILASWDLFSLLGFAYILKYFFLNLTYFWDVKAEFL